MSEPVSFSSFDETLTLVFHKYLLSLVIELMCQFVLPYKA